MVMKCDTGVGPIAGCGPLSRHIDRISHYCSEASRGRAERGTLGFADSNPKEHARKAATAS